MCLIQGVDFALAHLEHWFIEANAALTQLFGIHKCLDVEDSELTLCGSKGGCGVYGVFVSRYSGIDAESVYNCYRASSLIMNYISRRYTRSRRPAPKVN